MRIPESLRPGDTIGIAAPSFGATTEPYATRLKSAIRKFEERGYHVRTAPSVYRDDGLGISTDPASAAKDVMDLYADPEIRVLISCGGGELMNETISCIDFAYLKSLPPKWFMGYSDNTNLLVPLALICDVPGIYGPCATGFGKEWEVPETQAFGLLEGTLREVHGYDLFELPDDETRSENPLAPYHLTEPKVLTTYVHRKQESPSREEIRFHGILMGGCLDVLENLSGTKYAPIQDFLLNAGPVVWTLEACDLNPMTIRRTLWHLKTQGWFDTAAGFLIGRPLASFRQEIMGVDAYNAVTGVLGELDVPIVMDADFGHVAPMMPLIIGSPAAVHVKGNDLSIRYGLPVNRYPQRCVKKEP